MLHSMLPNGGGQQGQARQDSKPIASKPGCLTDSQTGSLLPFESHPHTCSPVAGPLSVIGARDCDMNAKYWQARALFCLMVKQQKVQHDAIPNSLNLCDSPDFGSTALKDTRKLPAPTPSGSTIDILLTCALLACAGSTNTAILGMDTASLILAFSRYPASAVLLSNFSVADMGWMVSSAAPMLLYDVKKVTWSCALLLKVTLNHMDVSLTAGKPFKDGSSPWGASGVVGVLTGVLLEGVWLGS